MKKTISQFLKIDIKYHRVIYISGVCVEKIKIIIIFLRIRNRIDYCEHKRLI